MKAILLSAGLGTRLRPLTLGTPKCLVPLGSRPIIDIWLRMFQKNGITEVLINTHHHSQQVVDYLANYSKGITIRTVFEGTLLGSLGTLLMNKDFYAGEHHVLVVYVDNFTYLNFRTVEQFHLAHGLPITMGVFHTKNPNECGIVELGRDGKVVSFEEKPKKPRSDLANAGIYIFDTEFLISHPAEKSEGPLDIGYHLLPGTLGKLAAFTIDSFFYDIGTLERLREANDQFVKSAHLFE